MPYFTRSPVWVLTLTLLLHTHALHAQPDADAAPDPGPVEITVEPHVLLFEQPTREDGTVDFYAALNKRDSRGVTKENNAFRALYLIAPKDDWYDESYYKRLDRLLDVQPGERQALPEYAEWMAFGEELGLSRDRWAEICESHVNGPFDDGPGSKLASWIKANDQAHRYIIDAVKRPRYWEPLVNDEGGTGLLIEKPKLHQDTARAYLRGLRHRANFLASEGKHKEAIASLLAMRQLARMQARGFTLHDLNHAYACHRLSGEALVDLISGQQLDGTQLAELSRRWFEDTPQPLMADHFESGHRSLVQDSMMQMAAGRQSAQCAVFELRGGPDEHFFLDDLFAHEDFDLNVGLTRVADFFKARAEVLRMTPYSDYRKEMAKWERYEQAAYQFAAQSALTEKDGEPVMARDIPEKQVTQHATTLLLYAMDVLPRANASLNVEYDWHARYAVLKMVTAIERYRLMHGSLPSSLTDLTPELLDHVPKDPFDGQRLKYKQNETSYAVYSVGRDLKDDAAADLDHLSIGDNGIRIPLSDDSR